MNEASEWALRRFSVSLCPDRRKEPVGHRLAWAARALAYGEKIEYSGPLRGFEMAGADGAFVPAKARIDGDVVVVSSDEVKTPVAVRYGRANVPDVNLFNQDGLPASPFSTVSRGDWIRTVPTPGRIRSRSTVSYDTVTWLVF